MCLETRFPVKSWVRGRGRERARRSPFLWSTAEESRKSLSVDLHPPLVPPPPPPSRSNVEEPTHWPENSSLSCGTSPAVSRRRSSGSTRGQGRSSMLSFARSPIQYVDFKGSKFRFVKEELCFDLYRRKGSCNFVVNEEDGRIRSIVDRPVIFTMELIVHRVFLERILDISTFEDFLGITRLRGLGK